jgi:hypothetical protein
MGNQQGQVERQAPRDYQGTSQVDGGIVQPVMKVIGFRS